MSEEETETCERCGRELGVDYHHIKNGHGGFVAIISEIEKCHCPGPRCVVCNERLEEIDDSLDHLGGRCQNMMCLVFGMLQPVMVIAPDPIRRAPRIPTTSRRS